jgi:hypothetical protein
MSSECATYARHRHDTDPSMALSACSRVTGRNEFVSAGERGASLGLVSALEHQHVPVLLTVEGHVEEDGGELPAF